MAETTEQRTWTEELRGAARMASSAEVPEATPAEGPDPYGNPDPEWLRIDWRPHLRQTEVVGAEVNYVEYGTGSPVLLVHGLGGSWRNWLETIPHLAKTHRVLAIDLPGFGSSPIPPWEISMPAYGRFLHDFCERIGLDSCPLIGSSMGGFIGTELAINEPERVERLVLVSAAGITWARARREPAAVFGRVARAAAPLIFKTRMEGLRRSRLRRLAYRGIVHDPNSVRPELLFEIVSPALEGGGFSDAVTALFGYDIRDRLVEIEVPTLVVWGRNDRVVPSPAAPRYKKLIGDNAEMVVFDRTGHLPMVERPVRFNRLIDEFLARDPDPTG